MGLQPSRSQGLLTSATMISTSTGAGLAVWAWPPIGMSVGGRCHAVTSDPDFGGRPPGHWLPPLSRRRIGTSPGPFPANGWDSGLPSVIARPNSCHLLALVQTICKRTTDIGGTKPEQDGIEWHQTDQTARAHRTHNPEGPHRAGRPSVRGASSSSLDAKPPVFSTLSGDITSHGPGIEDGAQEAAVVRVLAGPERRNPRHTVARRRHYDEPGPRPGSSLG
jgi:hypothetical protein